MKLANGYENHWAYFIKMFYSDQCYINMCMCICMDHNFEIPQNILWYYQQLISKTDLLKSHKNLIV